LDALNSFVSPNVGVIALLLAALVLALVVGVVSLGRRTAALDRRLASLTRGDGGDSLEAVLHAHLDRVQALSDEVDRLAAGAAILEGVQRRAIQDVGLVRYNPFEDTGGNQSFAVALLDAHGNGFIVSSLHARSGTRIYAKAVAAGKAESALSEEEAEALRRATAPAAAGPRTA
jgi:FlaG/FlaF family flagellin (archaellin)